MLLVAQERDVGTHSITQLGRAVCVPLTPLWLRYWREVDWQRDGAQFTAFKRNIV